MGSDNGVFGDHEINFRSHRRRIIRIIFRKIINEIKIILIALHKCSRRRTPEFIKDHRMQIEFFLEPRQVLTGRFLNIYPLDPLILLNFHLIYCSTKELQKLSHGSFYFLEYISEWPQLWRGSRSPARLG